MLNIKIKTDQIKLDQFLKWSNIVSSGGEAKSLIKAGKVLVNGELEVRRSVKLSIGDIIKILGQEETFKVIKE